VTPPTPNLPFPPAPPQTLSSRPERSAGERPAGSPHNGPLPHLQAIFEVLIIALFIATFILQPFRIPSESMEPTLLVGDFLLANKQSFSPSGPLDALLPPTTIHRGDLVIFYDPLDPGRDLIKRVIALPGDRLHLRNGLVYLNGQPLAEPYAVHYPAPPDTFRDDFPSLRHADPNADPNWWARLRRMETQNETTGRPNEITVPPNDYFVMGDNRNDSEDSRYWGFVPRSTIIARPLFVYASLAASPQPTTFLHHLLSTPRILH